MDFQFTGPGGLPRTFTVVENPTIEEVLLNGAKASCAQRKTNSTGLLTPAPVRLVEYFARYDLTRGS